MIYFFLISISILILYFFTLSNTIYGGDAGDLVSAILTKGFAHPPGYPLYTILGRLFVNLPINLTPAGKVTLVSTLATVFSLILLYLIFSTLLKKINKIIVLITILTISANYLVWLYAIVPEVFSLNVFIILSIFFTALKFKRNGRIKWLTLLLFFIGLGISHHHTFILILPSIYILIKKYLFSIQKSKIFLLVLSFLMGLIPLLYLPVVSFKNPEITWGEANTLSGFFGLLTRQAYGTFVPGQFITNSPIHRLIQLTNLNFFILADFTIIGYLLIIIGIVAIIKSSLIDKAEKIAVFLALFLFGPFFFFYANFPLRDKFELATVERFMLIFYFFLAIPYYFGLQWFFLKLSQLITKTVKRPAFFIKIAILCLCIIPIGLSIKNYRRLIVLKKTKIAERLGIDVIKNTQPNSIILLAGDTLLFNSQYVFFSNKNVFKDKIVIQSSKISAEYYRKSLKANYPKLVFSKKNPYSMENFINDNIKSFNIYSNDKYSLPIEFPYKWIVQGILFKIVDREYDTNNDKVIKDFWNISENKNLADYYLNSRGHWLNYFPNDILRVYATAHQNTAFYYLEQELLPQAFYHIKQALVLNPEDLDSLYLESIYYFKISNCSGAEKSIIKALNKSEDKLYLFQLEQLQKCYKDKINQERLIKLLKFYTDQSLKSLL